ncbi:Protein of unknown function [Pyronema omphalodes CBS 100304]|uniref:Uncharacterized protein n=1 Tax=Pyronema omphalodes (strain CBS 100304) TaxID=1076935 RepID=U4LGY8_PYROM|nr:Protein of unknown function [Pyronema omphalodes CBS 100304]
MILSPLRWLCFSALSYSNPGRKFLGYTREMFTCRKNSGQWRVLRAVSYPELQSLQCPRQARTGPCILLGPTKTSAILPTRKRCFTSVTLNLDQRERPQNHSHIARYLSCADRGLVLCRQELWPVM